MREGQYQEIARIVPSAEGSLSPRIQEKNWVLRPTCGFHREANQGLTVVICSQKEKDKPAQASFKGIELTK